MNKGKKMAVLVGCNYPNTPNELRGCYNDVLAMRGTLIKKFTFDPKCIEVLMDKPDSILLPTGANIKKALNEMVGRAEAGDVLYFHYSGHGTLIKSSNPTKKEEAIVPCDFNLITSVDFRHLVNRVPKGATFTILSDSCHSGGLIDKETEQIGPSTTALEDNNNVSASYKQKIIPLELILQHLSSRTNINTMDIGTHLLELFGPESSLMFQDPLIEMSQPKDKPLREDQGILLSGCQTNENSADVEIIVNGRKPCGAFSNAVQMVLKDKNHSGILTNRELVLQARKILMKENFKRQHPCLYCSHENAGAKFLYPAHKSM